MGYQLIIAKQGGGLQSFEVRYIFKVVTIVVEGSRPLEEQLLFFIAHSEGMSYSS